MSEAVDSSPPTHPARTAHGPARRRPADPSSGNRLGASAISFARCVSRPMPPRMRASMSSSRHQNGYPRARPCGRWYIESDPAGLSGRINTCSYVLGALLMDDL